MVTPTIQRIVHAVETTATRPWDGALEITFPRDEWIPLWREALLAEMNERTLRPLDRVPNLDDVYEWRCQMGTIRLMMERADA